MLTYKQYIAEKVSDTVFHKTSLQGASSILKSNRFRLSAAIGTQSERELNKNKVYYFSMARTPNSAYINSPTTGDIYFVLDGNKLNQNYKGEAVDYWGAEFRKLGKDEMEDRIFTDKQYIEPAIKYIKEIHVLLSYESKSTSMLFGDEITLREIDERELLALKNVYSICKKNNIPLYAYNNINNYLTRNKNKVVNVLEILKDKNAFKLEGSSYQRMKRKPFYSPIAELISKPLKPKSEFDDVNEWHRHLEKILSKRAYYDVKKYVYHKDDAIKSLDADIHNIKSDEKVSDFIKIMKKHNLKTPEEIADYLENKYKWGN